MKGFPDLLKTILLAALIFLFHVDDGFPADLSIAGSTMLYPLEKVWAEAYMKTHPDVQISVVSTGSGSGIYNAANGNVTIGASDAYLTRSLARHYPSLVAIPVALEDAQVIYNIPGINPSHVLRMDGPTLAKIYLGQILFWDDQEIQKLNPGVRFPHIPIKVIHRGGDSGTTFVFTDYLARTSNDWKRRIGRDRSPAWPMGSGYHSSDAVVAAVVTTPGSIGYVGLGWIKTYHLRSMALKNLDGVYVVGSVTSIQAAGRAAFQDKTVSSDFNRSIVWMLHGKDVYPDATFEFWMVSKTLTEQTMNDVKNLMRWAMIQGQAKKYTDKTGFAPLPVFFVKRDLQRILKKLHPERMLSIESGRSDRSLPVPGREASFFRP